MQLVPVDECDGDAGATGATRATDAVHVGLVVVGALVVDDVRDVVDVDAACCDVGGDEHVDLSGAELLECLLACHLTEVAVDGADGETALGEVVCDLLGGALGAREDHRRAAAVGLQDACDEFGLVHRVCAVHVLRGALVHRGVVGVLCADVCRTLQERAGEGDNGAGHGRGEEHRLLLLGQCRHDAFDVGEEAEVEHFVGLVENENGYLAEDQVALLREVEETAGGADDDVDALVELGDLRLVRATTVDGGDGEGALLAGGERDGEVLRRDLEVAGDLHAEFARRHDHERAGSVVERAQAALLCVHQAVQQRNAESEGLAHTRARLADQVAACQGEGESELLDRERVGLAVSDQRIDDVLVDAELGEGGRSVGVVDDGRLHAGFCHVFLCAFRICSSTHEKAPLRRSPRSVGDDVQVSASGAIRTAKAWAR